MLGICGFEDSLGKTICCAICFLKVVSFRTHQTPIQNHCLWSRGNGGPLRVPKIWFVNFISMRENSRCVNYKEVIALRPSRKNTHSHMSKLYYCSQGLFGELPGSMAIFYQFFAQPMDTVNLNGYKRHVFSGE